MKAASLVSGPYSAHLNPWLDAELKRATGLSIKARDLRRVMSVCVLSLTCVLLEKEIIFALLRDGKMIAAIKLDRVGASSWETLYEWLFSCPQK